MSLLKPEITALLISNGSTENRGKDHLPVVKLFTPDSSATWLLTEIDPDNPAHAFGLCDLGHGFPELGYVSLSELSVLRGALGLAVERDAYFEPLYPISIYAEAAREAGRIVTEEKFLAQTAHTKGETQRRKTPKPQPQ